jgi:hypothetical protein
MLIKLVGEHFKLIAVRFRQKKNGCETAVEQGGSQKVRFPSPHPEFTHNTDIK